MRRYDETTPAAPPWSPTMQGLRGQALALRTGNNSSPAVPVDDEEEKKKTLAAAAATQPLEPSVPKGAPAPPLAPSEETLSLNRLPYVNPQPDFPAFMQKDVPVRSDSGARLDGTAKGEGFLGNIANRGGFSTELSTGEPGTDEGFGPSMTPNLNPDEVDQIIKGTAEPNVYGKAQAYRGYRESIGASPFAGQGEQVPAMFTPSTLKEVAARPPETQPAKPWQTGDYPGKSVVDAVGRGFNALDKMASSGTEPYPVTKNTVPDALGQTIDVAKKAPGYLVGKAAEAISGDNLSADDSGPGVLKSLAPNAAAPVKIANSIAPNEAGAAVEKPGALKGIANTGGKLLNPMDVVKAGAAPGAGNSGAVNINEKLGIDEHGNDIKTGKPYVPKAWTVAPVEGREGSSYTTFGERPDVADQNIPAGQQADYTLRQGSVNASGEVPGQTPRLNRGDTSVFSTPWDKAGMSRGEWQKATLTGQASTPRVGASTEKNMAGVFSSTPQRWKASELPADRSETSTDMLRNALYDKQKQQEEVQAKIDNYRPGRNDEQHHDSIEQLADQYKTNEAQIGHLQQLASGQELVDASTLDKGNILVPQGYSLLRQKAGGGYSKVFKGEDKETYGKEFDSLDKEFKARFADNPALMSKFIQNPGLKTKYYLDMVRGRGNEFELGQDDARNLIIRNRQTGNTQRIGHADDLLTRD